jgi:hypothetical protein
MRQDKVDTTLLNYIYSWDSPVEVDFFGDKQNEQLSKEKAKLKKTEDYLAAVINNPGLGRELEKDIATGLIYSKGEMTKVQNRVRALEQTGDRIFLDVSLVSPTGERIIMSRQFSDDFGFMTDGYLEQDEIEDVVLALKSEGILDDQITKVREAMDSHGAIVVQRGAYEALFDLLDDATGYDLKKNQFAKKDKEFEEVKETFENEKAHGLSLEALKAVINIPVPPKATPIENTPFAHELQREVMTPELKKPTYEELGIKPAPAIPKPQPKPNVTTKLAPMPKELSVPRVPYKAPQVPTPTGGLKSLMDIRTVDDLKKVQTDHLRQGELAGQLNLIRAKIFSIAQANKLLPFYTVNAFEQSPLFKSYLAIGAAMIADPNPDRTDAFRKAVDTAGVEKLTLREFESVADLRKQIEQL